MVSLSPLSAAHQMVTMADDDQSECPLCMEPLDFDDLSFYPCPCEYQICRFCWTKILDEGNGLCPACRNAYNSEKPASFKPLTEEEIMKIRKTKKMKEQAKKQQKATESGGIGGGGFGGGSGGGGGANISKRCLAEVRVVQHNLVFVIGLPSRLADSDVLRGGEYFGKYGRVYKIALSRPTNSASGASQQQQQQASFGAYVTFYKSEDAIRALLDLRTTEIDRRLLKASLGTTKYCSSYLKGHSCPKPDCMYLHELGDPNASFTKEEMNAGKHNEFEERLVQQFLGSNGQKKAPAAAAGAAAAASAASGGAGQNHLQQQQQQNNHHHHHHQRHPAASSSGAATGGTAVASVAAATAGAVGASGPVKVGKKAAKKAAAAAAAAEKAPAAEKSKQPPPQHHQQRHGTSISTSISSSVNSTQDASQVVQRQQQQQQPQQQQRNNHHQQNQHRSSRDDSPVLAPVGFGLVLGGLGGGGLGGYSFNGTAATAASIVPAPLPPPPTSASAAAAALATSPLTHSTCDDLDFDPFSESQRGLSECLQFEQQQQQQQHAMRHNHHHQHQPPPGFYGLHHHQQLPSSPQRHQQQHQHHQHLRAAMEPPPGLHRHQLPSSPQSPSAAGDASDARCLAQTLRSIFPNANVSYSHGSSANPEATAAATATSSLFGFIGAGRPPGTHQTTITTSSSMLSSAAGGGHRFAPPSPASSPTPPPPPGLWSDPAIVSSHSRQQHQLFGGFGSSRLFGGFGLGQDSLAWPARLSPFTIDEPQQQQQTEGASAGFYRTA